MYWPDISSHGLGSFHSKFKRLSRQAGRHHLVEFRPSMIRHIPQYHLLQVQLHFPQEKPFESCFALVFASLIDAHACITIHKSTHEKKASSWQFALSLHVGQMDLFYTLFHRCLNQGGSVQHRFYFPASCIDQPSSSSEPDLGAFKLKKHITRYIILNHVTQITILDRY